MKRILMMFMLMPLMALATTWYVDGTNGSDSYSGKSQSVAKKTIQAAIDAAADSDTILVAPGTYAPIQSENKQINIVGSNGYAATIIDGRNATRCAKLGIKHGDNATVLDGFTIASGHTRSELGAGVLYGTLRNCYIVGH